MRKFQALYEKLVGIDKNPMQVTKKRMYWQARKSLGVPEVGFSIPKWKPTSLMHVEKVLEEGRLEFAPDAPSRLDCIYLCDEVGDFSWCGDHDDNNHIMIVEATGKLFQADAEIYIRVRDDVEMNRSGLWDSVEWYWTSGGYTLRENLLDGEASM